MFRSLPAALVVITLVAALTGCIQNRPDDAIGWLRGQSGVTAAEVMSDHTDITGSTGIIRGELAADLGAEALAKLVDDVQGYLAGHDGVGIRLGVHDVDFAVSTDNAATAGALDLWERVVRIPVLAGAVVYDDAVHARVLRPKATSALAYLDGLGVDLQLEGLNNQEAIDDDTEQDDFFGDDIVNIDSLILRWAVGCTPSAEERYIAEYFLSTADIGGGTLELCGSYDLFYLREAPLALRVPALYDTLEIAGLLELPVTVHQISAAAPDGHVVTVTPGDPAAFEVLAALESDAAPPDLYYTLFDDRSLEVIQYDTPTGELLSLVSSSAVAPTLPFIRIEGDPVAIGGTLAELPLLLEQALALAATDAQFTNVELNTDAGTVDLSSPVATDPDVVSAAQALRDSGAWVDRTIYVNYLQTALVIENGVARLADESYTDPHVVEAFLAAWNATA